MCLTGSTAIIKNLAMELGIAYLCTMESDTVGIEKEPRNLSRERCLGLVLVINTMSLEKEKSEPHRLITTFKEEKHLYPHCGRELVARRKS